MPPFAFKTVKASAPLADHLAPLMIYRKQNPTPPDRAMASVISTVLIWRVCDGSIWRSGPPILQTEEDCMAHLIRASRRCIKKCLPTKVPLDQLADGIYWNPLS